MDRNWEHVKESLNHVYWIGGGAAAGKTTISRLLCDEFGFTRFSGDKRWIEHWQTATVERNPIAHRIGSTLKQGDRFDWFFDRSGNEIADDYFEMARLEFEDAVDELLEMPRESPIVVDAFLGSPEFVLTVAKRERAVFLTCTDDFSKKTWMSRTTEGAPGFLPMLRQQMDTCSDPQSARDNFIDSNVIESRFMADDCRRGGATLIVTGGEMTLEDAYAAVKTHFQLL